MVLTIQIFDGLAKIMISYCVTTCWFQLWRKWQNVVADNFNAKKKLFCCSIYVSNNFIKNINFAQYFHQYPILQLNASKWSSNWSVSYFPYVCFLMSINIVFSPRSYTSHNMIYHHVFSSLFAHKLICDELVKLDCVLSKMFDKQHSEM